MTRRTATFSIGVAVVGAAACAIGAVVSGAGAFFAAYLVAFLFFIEIAFGCLGLVLLHTLTGGGWGNLARRPLYSGASTMPLFAAFFVPILVGLSTLYPWARPAEVAADALLRHKAAYLNTGFFAGRAVLYLALWSALALFFFRGARRRERRGLAGPSRWMRTLAGPGLLACGLTMTFATIDWVMSLDPHWFSTVIGLLIVVGSLLSAMAFSIVVVTSDMKEDEIPPQGLHDLGNLLLVFTMLWAYLSFTQYLIIYSGNIADEVPFFIHRTEGGWQHIALALVVLHFTLPFVVLLSRRTKRSPRKLRLVAIGVLVMRLVELFWFVAPNFRGHDLAVGLLDFAAPALVGGLWFFGLTWRLKQFDGEAKARPSAAR